MIPKPLTNNPMLHKTLRSLVFTAFLVAIGLGLAFACHAFEEAWFDADNAVSNAVVDVLAEPAPPAPPDGADMAEVIIRDYALHHPWLAVVLLAIGALRVIFKPLFSYLHANNVPGAGDYELLANAQASTPFALLLHCLDWLASIKLVHPQTSVDAVNATPNYTVKTT